jgi:hemoglobin/transferrin/lactoferrin receptor protein
VSRSTVFSHRLRLLPWLIASGFGTIATAQEAGPTRIGSLGEIVVSGTRSEQIKDDIPATVEVINREQIEFEQINNLRDIARDIPNVSVRRAPARFGLATGSVGRDGDAGFNIRGLDGNRVLLMTDGIRIPRSYVFSANAFGRNYFDLGLIERIEIIKGPASALYGSDGLGGLVNFITRQPDTFLADCKSFGGSANVGYSGDDNGWQGGVTLAGKASDTVSWLISANGSRAHEVENMGTNYARNSDRTAPNPELSNTQSLLAKLIVRPNADLTHNLTFEHVGKSTSYDLLSGISKPPFTSTSVTALGALTDQQRDRLTWDGRLRVNSVLADNLLGYVSYQRADSREQAWEKRYTAADRMRDVNYSENTWQAGLQADKTLRMSGDWSQRITYGIDYANTQVENLQTGLVPPVGEVYPLKRFPDTTEKTAAFYIQDEFIHDQWSITPGVRFDHFDIDADQTGFTPRAVSLSDSAVSPKLGVLYRATPQWTLYGNYAAGFKAPNAFQVNNFF